VEPPVWELEGAMDAISGRSPLLVNAVEPDSALALVTWFLCISWPPSIIPDEPDTPSPMLWDT